MVKPDDDFEDFDDDEPVILEASRDTMEVSAGAADSAPHDTRRKIEDILEARRLREEFGDLS